MMYEGKCFIVYVPLGHQRDSNQSVDMRSETDLVSKSLCGKVPSQEVGYSINMCRLLL